MNEFNFLLNTKASFGNGKFREISKIIKKFRLSQRINFNV